MDKPKRTRREADRRPWEERKHPYMWADYDELPTDSLTFDQTMVRLVAPYAVCVTFFSTTRKLADNRFETDSSLTGRGILPGDLLIFDCSRTTPEDDAIMLVRDGRERVSRICKVLADGFVEFHAAAAGYPILNGEREIVGTLAAVVRATDGKEDQSWS
jgi:hypothetical protein